MYVSGNRRRWQRSSHGTQALGSPKTRAHSWRVSCEADRKSFCRTNRCCSYSTSGSANWAKRILPNLFHCFAGACRVSTRLRAAVCSKKFSRGGKRVQALVHRVLPTPTLLSRLHCHCSIKSSAWEIPHDLSKRAMAKVATHSRRGGRSERTFRS